MDIIRSFQSFQIHTHSIKTRDFENKMVQGDPYQYGTRVGLALNGGTHTVALRQRFDIFKRTEQPFLTLQQLQQQHIVTYYRVAASLYNCMNQPVPILQ